MQELGAGAGREKELEGEKARGRDSARATKRASARGSESELQQHLLAGREQCKITQHREERYSQDVKNICIVKCGRPLNVDVFEDALKRWRLRKDRLTLRGGLDLMV